MEFGLLDRVSVPSESVNFGKKKHLCLNLSFVWCGSGILILISLSNLFYWGEIIGISSFPRWLGSILDDCLPIQCVGISKESQFLRNSMQIQHVILLWERSIVTRTWAACGDCSYATFHWVEHATVAVWSHAIGIHDHERYHCSPEFMAHMPHSHQHDMYGTVT